MIYTINGGYANTYLVEGQGGLIAIDVGTRLAARKVADLVKERHKDLRLITATHFHIDHIGGVSRLRRLCPEAEVNFFFRVGKYLSGEESLDIPHFSSWVKGLAPTVSKVDNHLRNAYQVFISRKVGIPLPLLRYFHFLGLRPKCELKEGCSIPFLPDWSVIETRGHTTDSICFYQQGSRTLVSGDTILNMEGSGAVNDFCYSRKDIEDSFTRLLTLDVENIYPGHGEAIIGVQKALTRVKS